ncbi:hypothetical protein FJZ31_11450 [Candidatus Poribacteria bacterium]|nr:hypothetical protein [Candidatus Poribacteria bacterium]
MFKQIYFFLFLTLWPLCALTIAPCVMAGTFRDDFEDGNLDGWRQEFPFEQKPTLWNIVDGELECERWDWNSTILITGEPEWRDYTIEYDVKLIEDLGLGDVDFIARYKSPVGTHLIYICFGDAFGIPAAFAQRFPGDVRTIKPFDPLDLTKWYHLKLEVKDKNFNLWLNGKIVLEHQDDVVKDGAVGIGLANYTARFDNVEISGADVPDVTPPTWKSHPVHPRGKLTTTWGEIK